MTLYCSLTKLTLLTLLTSIDDNFADDNSTYAVEKDVMTLLKTLGSETFSVLNWFRMTEMTANNSKCHLIVLNFIHLSRKRIFRK